MKKQYEVVKTTTGGWMVARKTWAGWEVLSPGNVGEYASEAAAKLAIAILIREDHTFAEEETRS